MTLYCVLVGGSRAGWSESHPAFLCAPATAAFAQRPGALIWLHAAGESAALPGEEQDEVNMAENEEIAELDIDLVAERPIIPVTRFEDDGSVGVEWLGRCWAWLGEDGPPELREVVVKDGEVVKLLEPGQVRRVRARQRPGDTPDGGGEVLEVWIDLAREAPEDRRAAARGLFEGGMVRIDEGSFQKELAGKIGKLVRFPSATVQVDGRGHIVSIMDLEPVEESPDSEADVGGDVPAS